MSRRRAAREQEREAFLEQNPETVEYETRITVGREDLFKNQVIEEDLEDEAPEGPFVAQVTQNGEPTFVYTDFFMEPQKNISWPMKSIHPRGISLHLGSSRSNQTIM